ncbi:hypothetical protein QOT17_009479 [Balamuthia mandrillaris]
MWLNAGQVCLDTKSLTSDAGGEEFKIAVTVSETVKVWPVEAVVSYKLQHTGEQQLGQLLQELHADSTKFLELVENIDLNAVVLAQETRNAEAGSSFNNNAPTSGSTNSRPTTNPVPYSYGYGLSSNYSSSSTSSSFSSSSSAPSSYLPRNFRPTSTMTTPTTLTTATASLTPIFNPFTTTTSTTNTPSYLNSTTTTPLRVTLPSASLSNSSLAPAKEKDEQEEGNSTIDIPSDPLPTTLLSLQQLCAESIKKSVTIDNVVELLSAITQHSQPLTEYCLQFLSRNLNKVKKTKAYKLIDKDIETLIEGHLVRRPRVRRKGVVMSPKQRDGPFYPSTGSQSPAFQVAEEFQVIIPLLRDEEEEELLRTCKRPAGKISHITTIRDEKDNKQNSRKRTSPVYSLEHDAEEDVVQALKRVAAVVDYLHEHGYIPLAVASSNSYSYIGSGNLFFPSFVFLKHFLMYIHQTK